MTDLYNKPQKADRLQQLHSRKHLLLDAKRRAMLELSEIDSDLIKLDEEIVSEEHT
jgi:hypothetical protein